MDEKTQKELEKALKSDEVQKIYFNGFTCSVGPGDILISLLLNGKSIAILNTSYTMAKTFSTKLNGVIKILEDKTENVIMMTDFIQDKMGKLADQKADNESTK